MLYEIHMLKHYPPGNLNRDDTGSPKTCYFGGSLRGRISSQCLKRSWRTSTLFENLLGERGIRSRKLPQLVKEELLFRGMEETMAELAMSKVTGIGNKDGKENDKDITSQTMFFTRADIRAIADVLENMVQEAGTEKGFKKVKASDVAKAVKKVGVHPMTVDIALFGRMVTSEAFDNVEASVQTAHALSTHIVNQESDYFTAMDDLLGDDETGADMVGDVEYNSCCYYHYISIDTDKLNENLKDAPNAEELIETILPAMLEVMAYSNPSGKQNSFASQVLPEVLYVEAKTKKIPTSYANAFAQPVRFGLGTKLIEESTQKLVDEINLMQDAYALEKVGSAWFAPRSKELAPKGADRANTLKELLEICLALPK